MSYKTYGRVNKNGANISETVYSLLRKNIVNLTLIPGKLVSEKEISEKLQVSRTPVREAFIRLSNEALVNIIPQKGTFVSKIDLSRVQEERFLRESLECSNLKLFMKHHSSESIDRLRKNIDKQRTAIDAGNIVDFLEYDDQFHAIMFYENNKELCYKLMQSFASHYRRIRYLSMFLSNASHLKIDQHVELIDAIEQNESSKAQKIMTNHIQELIIEKNKICEKYPEYFQQEQKFLADVDIFEKDAAFERLLSDQSVLEDE